jgi:hypothetical protein
MAFHVTENLYYYIMQLVFKIKKYLLPIPGGGVHGQLGYASHLVLSCTPVGKSSTPAEKDLLVHTFSGFRMAIRGTSTVSECRFLEY